MLTEWTQQSGDSSLFNHGQKLDYQTVTMESKYYSYIIIYLDSFWMDYFTDGVVQRSRQFQILVTLLVKLRMSYLGLWVSSLKKITTFSSVVNTSHPYQTVTMESKYYKRVNIGWRMKQLSKWRRWQNTISSGMIPVVAVQIANSWISQRFWCIPNENHDTRQKSR